ncbi:MAG TPA: serine/threonine-protein kinase [Gemmatimonadales bacterium]|nr:serine/threonine-protein kinase [Gemmatimonadales bacterium]
MSRARVDQLFAQFIDSPADERERLLAAVTEPRVREELQRLLEHHERLSTDPDSTRFLESIDLSLASRLLDEDREQPGRIGRFEVIQRIGRGASGVVFLARDPELGREVAVKLLDPDLSTSPSAIRRFKEEARTASQLDHPNVVTIYEAGETQEGRLFIAMAYHEGETLRDRIRRGALPRDEALTIAGEVAGGLAAAHADGIVHRDIKPENILLTSHGARIVDFGIARAVRGEPTLTGSMAGTAAYMSPEQTRGSGIDHRTDIWSLGVVMYEMLTGERPFAAQAGDALVYSIRNDPAVPVSGLVPDLPASLGRTIERCLAKDPAKRYQSALELKQALSHPDARPRQAHRRTFGAAALLALLAACVWWALDTGEAAPQADSSPAPGVAVLPWRVTSAGLEDLEEGMVDMLSYSVDGVEGLRKISPAVVMNAWRKLGSPIDEQGRLTVGRNVDARYLITGSAVRLAGGHLSLIADVRDMDRNRVRGSARVQGPMDSVSTLVDQLMLELLRLNLLPSDGTSQPASLRTVTTSSLPALKAFLAGESEYRLARWPEAAQHYMRALDHDPGFARALYRLIKSNDWGAGLGNTQAYLAQLESLVDGLPDRDRMLIRGDMASRFPGAMQLNQMPQIILLDSLLTRFPDEVEGWAALGDRYYHDRGQLLLPAEGYRTAFERAIELNPYYAEPYLHLIEDAMYRLDSTEARRLVSEYESIHRGRLRCSLQLPVDLAWGSEEARRKAMAALDTVPADALWECLPRTGTYPVRDDASELIWARVSQEIADLEQPLRVPAYFTYRLRGRVARGQSLAIANELAAMERATGPSSWWAERTQIMLHLAGFRDSATAHRAARTLTEMPPTGLAPSVTARIWVGLLAASEGRWSTTDSMIDQLDSLAPVLAREFDRKAGIASSSHADVLRAYQALVRGGITNLPAMDSTLAGLYWAGLLSPAGVLRLMVGHLLLEWGELAAARRYFESFGSYDLFGTSSELPLGRIAEAQGNRGEAIEHYRRFIGWWNDPDPELRGKVEEARAGLRRLGVSDP